MAKMDSQEYQNKVTRIVEDARKFHDDNISPSREEALNYLRGETDVPKPEKGFSSITSSVSRDSLYRVMTKLMEMFTGAADTVEFIPVDEKDENLARQQTDVANAILMVKNKGYRVIHDTFRSAVGSGKVAGMKVTWSEAEEVWQDDYTDLSDEELEEFESDPHTEAVELETVEEIEQIAVQQPDGSEIRIEIPQKIHNATVRFKKPSNRIVVESIPAEELIFDRRAIDSDTAKIVAQDTQRTRSDLIALGMSEDFIDRHGGSGGSGSGTNQDTQEKRARVGFDIDEDDDSGSTELTTYRLLDVWARIDKDGDGIAEWRHFLAIGDHAEVWPESDEMTSGPQIAMFMPYLRENTALGDSLHDLTKDIADTRTCLMRGMIDNLKQTNFPKMMAVEGQISNWASIQNRNAIGIQKRAGAVEYLPTPYVVDGVLKGLEFLDQQLSKRIGVSDAAMGLDPDSLQASSDFGVRETFAQGQGGILMVARNLAETGMKDLFKLIIKLYARHQNEPETMRLRGEFVQVNPRQFDANLDLKVNVGLGTGTKEAKMGSLMFILQQQKETMASTPEGQENEITSSQHVVNTLDDILELQDIPAEGRYIKNPPDPPPEPPPDPAEAEAEAAQAEAEAKVAAAQAEAEVKAQVELQKAQIKAQSDIQIATIKAQVELAIAQGDAEVDALQAQLKAQLQNRELDMEAALEIRGQNIEATLKGAELKQRELRRPN